MDPSDLVTLRAVASTSVDNALDIIYQGLDEWMWTKRFGEIDTLLGNPEVLTLPIDLILGYLIATGACRHRLTKRGAFVKAAAEVFTKAGEDPKDLLPYWDLEPSPNFDPYPYPFSPHDQTQEDHP